MAVPSRRGLRFPCESSGANEVVEAEFEEQATQPSVPTMLSAKGIASPVAIPATAS